MLAILQSGPTAPTITEFADRVKDALTGALYVPSLNATYWNLSNSYSNTLNTGWTIYDNAAGTAANGVTPYVLSCPTAKGGTAYLHVFSIDATSLGFSTYFSWDVNSNTGTYRSHTPAASGWGQVVRPGVANNSYLILAASGGSSAGAFAYISSTATSTGWVASIQRVMVSDFVPFDPFIDGVTYPDYYIWGDNNSGTGSTGFNGAIGKVWNTFSAAVTGPHIQSNGSHGHLHPLPMGGAASAPAQTGGILNVLGTNTPGLQIAANRNANGSLANYIPACRLQVAGTGSNQTASASVPMLLGGPIVTDHIRVTRTTWNYGDTVNFDGYNWVVADGGSQFKLLLKDN